MMNLEEEIRSDYTVSHEMKRLWKTQLDILNELERVCKMHHLRYFAGGGTLLGAVRHRGFIPWDDDIDVYMLRADYEKLKSLGNEFSEGYFLQTPYTDRTMRQHAQIRKDGTTFLIQGDYGKKYHKGVFIDIFIFDKVPDDPEELEKFHRKIQKKWRRLISPEKKHSRKVPLWVNRVYNLFFFPLRKVLYELILVLKGGRKKAFERFERYVSKYDDQDVRRVCEISFWGTYKRKLHVFQKEDFSSVVMLPFEDRKIPCPCGYEKILEAYYGDWTKIVKGGTIHGKVFFDLDKDYREYDRLTRKEFMNLFQEK